MGADGSWITEFPYTVGIAYAEKHKIYKQLCAGYLIWDMKAVFRETTLLQ